MLIFLNELGKKFIRKWYALKSLRSHVTSLNRRAAVEQVLLDVANGKREPLSREECRKLAFKLAGVD